ncbi:MAG: phage protein Gp36 family protein [Akkermansia sp.]
MTTVLTESDLLTSLTAQMLADVRAQSPAGEDPIAGAMMHACAAVDSYCAGTSAPANVRTKWACDLASFDIVKILSTATDDMTKAYEETLAALREVRDGSFHFSDDSGDAIAFGSACRMM